MALTKTVDGKPLPAEKFAMVGDPGDISTWHLPIDESHIDSALKLFGHETHGSADDKKKAARKIAAAAREHGIDADRVRDFESKYTQHADFGGQWIEIFKAGQYKPQAGWDGNATVADLQRVAANYDPSFHEAPAVIGHPENDDPAHGWVDRLKVAGPALLAKFKEVDPDFENSVQSGRFKKRSASFYVGADGKFSGLRHVGFLGAKPPEVKGLKNLTFDDHGQSFTEVEFGEEDGMAAGEKTIREQIAEFFAETLGSKKNGATASFSEDDAERIAEQAAKTATAPLQSTIDTLKNEIEQHKVKFAERETAFAANETKQRAIDAVNKLKTDRKWVPAFEKAGLPLVFEELAKSTVTIEFGEADQAGNKPKVAPLQVLVNFMEGLPTIVPTGTFFGGGSTQKRDAASGTGDPLTDLAKARAKEKNISFSEALTQVAEEQPELTVPGGPRAGSV